MLIILNKQLIMNVSVNRQKWDYPIFSKMVHYLIFTKVFNAFYPPKPEALASDVASDTQALKRLLHT